VLLDRLPGPGLLDLHDHLEFLLLRWRQNYRPDLWLLVDLPDRSVLGRQDFQLVQRAPCLLQLQVVQASLLILGLQFHQRPLEHP